MVMTAISNNEIRLMLYCGSFSLPLGLMIHLQVWIYFTMTAVILVLWHCPYLSPTEGKDMKPQRFLILSLQSCVEAGRTESSPHRNYITKRQKYPFASAAAFKSVHVCRRRSVVIFFVEKGQECIFRI